MNDEITKSAEPSIGAILYAIAEIGSAIESTSPALKGFCIGVPQQYVELIAQPFCLRSSAFPVAKSG